MSKSKKKSILDNLEQFAKEINSAAIQIDALPENQEYTQEDIINLDDVRQAAMRLANDCEAAIKTFEGVK